MPTETNQTVTVAQVAELCGGRLTGGGDYRWHDVTGIETIDGASATAVSWLIDPKFQPLLSECKAAAVIGNEATVGAFDRGIVCDDPEWAVSQVLQHFHVPLASPAPGIDERAIVHASVILGEGAAVGAGAIVKRGTVIGARTAVFPGASVGADVRIGADSVLFDRCVVYDRCALGDRVIIHSGAIIGADGFGYIHREGKHVKLRHLGHVILEDEVEVGANTCIDRGKTGPTRIGRGTKIDNLVQIAHNVQIGPQSIIIAMSGLSGSAKLGAGVIMAGKTAVSHGVTIGDGAVVAGASVVAHDLADNARVWGIPARDFTEAMRDVARVKKLPKLIARVAKLEKRLAELSQATGADGPESS